MLPLHRQQSHDLMISVLWKQGSLTYSVLRYFEKLTFRKRKKKKNKFKRPYEFRVKIQIF